MPTVGADDRRRAWWFVLAALLSVATFVAIYWIAIRTARGQRWDDGALAGRVYESARVRDRSADLLSVISVSSLAALGTALILVALARRRPRLAVGTGILVFGSVVLTEVLKRVLDRPLLVGEPSHWQHNTLPSGHSTIGLSLGAALVLVVPHRHRLMAGLVGFAFGAAIAIGTLTAGWHRPSDALAAACVVTATASTICAVLIRWRGGVGRPEPPGTVHPAFRIAIAALVAAFPIALAVAALVVRHRGLQFSEIGRRFFVAAAAVGVASLFATFGIAVLLWRVTLDPPDAGSATPETAAP